MTPGDIDVINLTGDDVPEDADGGEIEANLNAAAAAEEAATTAIRRLRELYVGLDGIADGNANHLFHTEEIRRHQTETQALLGKLKDERDAWAMRRDALRDRLEEDE